MRYLWREGADYKKLKTFSRLTTEKAHSQSRCKGSDFWLKKLTIHKKNPPGKSETYP